MGHYHNKLDKKYFNKSVYAKKFEETFNIRFKDYPLQYEIAFDTYNAVIGVNNILFSLNYIPIKMKVDNMIHLINAYLNKYKNKIKKSYDLQCIRLYDGLETDLEELKEMKKDYEEKGTKYNLKHFENDYELLLRALDNVNFDKLVDSKELYFVKKANDKLPKKVNLKLLNDLDIHTNTMYDIDKQKELNEKFISDYYKRTGIDLTKEKEQQYFIFDILTRVKDLNNAFVDYYIYNKDKTVVNMYDFYLKHFLEDTDISLVKDIIFVNVFNKLNDVHKFINEDNIDSAFTIIKEIIDQFKDLYERMS